MRRLVIGLVGLATIVCLLAGVLPGVGGADAASGADTAAGAPVSGAASFTDISSSPYKSAIEDLAQSNTIGGYDDGTFRPLNPLLRAQFAKIVDGALGFAVTEDLTSPFVDLGTDDPTDLYPHEYVAMSWKKGITQGKTSTTFEPFLPVTRAQAVSMAVRGVSSVRPRALVDPGAGFQSTWGDFDANHGANVRLAEHNGLLSGLPLGTLDPWGAMTRGEAAQLLNNVRTFLSTASPAAVEGTASDAALVAAIRAGWPEVGAIFLPTELPQGWRLSGPADPRFREEADVANPGFWYVPMGIPPSPCAYVVEYTNGEDTVALSAGYWPASGSSRYFHELAESSSAVDILLEGDQWRSFAYLENGTDVPEYQVLFVERTSANEDEGRWYVEIDYPVGGATAAAEAIARAVVRVP